MVSEVSFGPISIKYTNAINGIIIEDVEASLSSDGVQGEGLVGQMRILKIASDGVPVPIAEFIVSVENGETVIRSADEVLTGTSKDNLPLFVELEPKEKIEIVVSYPSGETKQLYLYPRPFELTFSLDGNPIEVSVSAEEDKVTISNVESAQNGIVEITMTKDSEVAFIDFESKKAYVIGTGNKVALPITSNTSDNLYKLLEWLGFNAKSVDDGPYVIGGVVREGSASEAVLVVPNMKPAVATSSTSVILSTIDLEEREISLTSISIGDWRGEPLILDEMGLSKLTENGIEMLKELDEMISEVSSDNSPLLYVGIRKGNETKSVLPPYIHPLIIYEDARKSNEDYTMNDLPQAVWLRFATAFTRDGIASGIYSLASFFDKDKFEQLAESETPILLVVEDVIPGSDAKVVSSLPIIPSKGIPPTPLQLLVSYETAQTEVKELIGQIELRKVNDANELDTQINYEKAVFVKINVVLQKSDGTYTGVSAVSEVPAFATESGSAPLFSVEKVEGDDSDTLVFTVLGAALVKGDNGNYNITFLYSPSALLARIYDALRNAMGSDIANEAMRKILGAENNSGVVRLFTKLPLTTYKVVYDLDKQSFVGLLEVKAIAEDAISYLGEDGKTHDVPISGESLYIVKVNIGSATGYSSVSELSDEALFKEVRSSPLWKYLVAANEEVEMEAIYELMGGIGLAKASGSNTIKVEEVLSVNPITLSVQVGSFVSYESLKVILPNYGYAELSSSSLLDLLNKTVTTYEDSPSPYMASYFVVQLIDEDGEIISKYLPIDTLLNAMGFSLSISSVSADGWNVTATINKLELFDSVYISYMKDGKVNTVVLDTPGSESFTTNFPVVIVAPKLVGTAYNWQVYAPEFYIPSFSSFANTISAQIEVELEEDSDSIEVKGAVEDVMIGNVSIKDVPVEVSSIVPVKPEWSDCVSDSQLKCPGDYEIRVDVTIPLIGAVVTQEVDVRVVGYLVSLSDGTLRIAAAAPRGGKVVARVGTWSKELSFIDKLLLKPENTSEYEDEVVVKEFSGVSAATVEIEIYDSDGNLVKSWSGIISN